MSPLRLDILPPATATVLAKLADEPALTGFYLVGGTAMALQAGHRRSLDIDLIHFGQQLEKNRLYQAMRQHGATLITPQSMISTAKINGFDLLAHVQDYALDGVKVQCFVDPQSARYSTGLQTIPGWRFGLADLPTLFRMKSALLTKRSRSRDYYDLQWFCQHGKTLAEIITAAQEADDSPETATLVEHKLLGLIPLDSDDEGLDPVNVQTTIADIYRYFEMQVQKSEIAIALQILSQQQPQP